MRKLREWAARYVGRRGAFLAFLTVLDIGYGFGLLTGSLPQRTPGAMLARPAWGWVWVGVGVICASGVLARRDKWQFTAAAGLKALWAMLYLDASIVLHQPKAWVSTVVWMSFAFTVMLIAGWPEPGSMWKQPGRKKAAP